MSSFFKPGCIVASPSNSSTFTFFAQHSSNHPKFLIYWPSGSRPPPPTIRPPSVSPHIPSPPTAIYSHHWETVCCAQRLHCVEIENLHALRIEMIAASERHRFNVWIIGELILLKYIFDFCYKTGEKPIVIFFSGCCYGVFLNHLAVTHTMRLSVYFEPCDALSGNVIVSGNKHDMWSGFPSE